ncbi:metal-dependent hydrolase [Albibacterium profundi]|uniref:Metal-dependent hydrolase n=1 Tax=Albibacterium profundi TaxID=3134906 RepID=A0ABV5CDK5_9SPHI
MKATYFGHSTVHLDLNGTRILFDPFITPNELAKDIEIGSINPHYIFLSHCHGDHVHDMAQIQQQSDAQVVAIVETGDWVQKQGVPEDKVTAMNFGGTMNGGFGSAKIVYALHTNGAPDGSYAGAPAGYLLKSQGKTIYFAGDTALTLEMQLLKDEQIDWAFLPIGGYFTMDVNDAIQAAKLINCQNIIGIHYNTFPPIKIDEADAQKRFQDVGLNLHLLEIGSSIDL